MKRILITSTELMMLDFLIPHVENLMEKGYEVELACSQVGNRFDKLKETFRDSIIIHKVDLYRNPVQTGNLKGYRQLKSIIKNGHFDLVWTNEPVMGVMTRLAARKARKNGLKVMYIAHGFHFFKGAPMKNWLFFFPVEWLLAHYTDVLITINREDYHLAKRFMHAGKVSYIPGIGISMDKFSVIPIEREEMRRKLGVTDDEYMILSVGELSKRKNHSIVIETLRQLGNSKIKYFICGCGPKKEEICQLVAKYKLNNQVQLLGFRSDISDLLHAADLFVFPSLQEGLPVALMEAIATKTPVICSDIRGNTDLIKDKKFLFNPQEKQSLVNCLKNTMGMDMSDIVERNYQLLKNYDLKKILRRMDSIYGSIDQTSVEFWGGVIAFYERQTILQELGIDGSRYILLSAGELSERKNQETVIRALNRLHRTDVIYLIAGEGRLEKRFQSMIQEYGLEKQVFMIGYRMDIGNLCKLADIFVHIPVREGLGMAPLEAMANGLPLISSYINGMKDYTMDGLTGSCVFNPVDIDEVSEAIQKSIDDLTRGADYKQINKIISEKYSLKNSEQFMEKIYGLCDI